VGCCGLNSSGSGYGCMAGCCHRGNESWGTINVDELSDSQLLKKDSAPWS